jgi:hypothetical protein
MSVVCQTDFTHAHSNRRDHIRVGSPLYKYVDHQWNKHRFNHLLSISHSLSITSNTLSAHSHHLSDFEKNKESDSEKNKKEHQRKEILQANPFPVPLAHLWPSPQSTD